MPTALPLLDLLSPKQRMSASGSACKSVLSLKNISFEVKLKNGEMRRLVDDVSVDVTAGELLAIMGPSGAGKSTLLDLMSCRKATLPGGSISFNGRQMDEQEMQNVSAFVEQDDALLGVLTVRESITYSLRLYSPLLPRREVTERVERVITALGLQSCADQRIGTSLQRGISGGQKRRTTAACAIVTFPRILFLDEVTSGLDSTAAREVITHIKALAVEEGIVVVASIHQPAVDTLSQFTDLLLIGAGKTCYLGPVGGLEGFLEQWGRPTPRFISPSDHAMNYLNNDFGTSYDQPAESKDMHEFYLSSMTHTGSPDLKNEKEEVESESASVEQQVDLSRRDGTAGPATAMFWNTMVLSERKAKNYTRNLFAYGLRGGMYGGMGFMVALIWMNLGLRDSSIEDRLSCHFFGIAFIAISSAAGVPAFLEERAVFYREKKNGLYSTLPFLISDSFVSLPFLIACALLYILISYWAIGLHTGAAAFFRYLFFTSIAVTTAESSMVLIACALPYQMVAMSLSAFSNGLWLSLAGYFMKSKSLPRYLFYSLHYVDFLTYSFELLANSDLRRLTFECQRLPDNSCFCSYQSSTPETCTVSGEDVLRYLEIEHISYAKWCGVLIGMITIFRILAYIVLRIRNK